MSSYKDKLIERIEDLELENKKLKELLKKCKSSVLFEADVIKEIKGKYSKDYKIIENIITTIDEVSK